MCREWVGRPGRAGVVDLNVLPIQFDLVQNRQLFQLGKDADLTVLSFSDLEYDCFGVRLIHPDSKDGATSWTTDICYSVNKPAETGRASVTTSVARTTGIIRPMYVQPSRPAIVKTIVEKWSAREGIPIQATAHLLCDNNLASFLDLLQSSNRRLPVLFVSAKNLDDKPLLDADEVADQVVGLCHVFVGQSRFPSLRLKDRLGSYLNCWDGAIRIYWPGFTFTDDPFWHRVWTPGPRQ